MPSIFIWKSSKPNTSKKTIRIYSGSNWMLEDNDYSSKSYKFIEQIVIPGFNDSVITFNVKNMPQDWIGTELLEVTQVNYDLIKTDNYGTLEQVGEWMRFTSVSEIEFNKNNLESELNKIISWMNGKKEKEKEREKPQFQPKKYNNIHPIQNKQHTHQQYQKKPYSLDHTTITQNFQQFLIKFDINTISQNILGKQSKVY